MKWKQTLNSSAPGLTKLPTVRQLSIDHIALCKAAKVQRISEIKTGQALDISTYFTTSSNTLNEFLLTDEGIECFLLLRDCAQSNTALWIGSATVAQAKHFAQLWKTDNLWECSQTETWPSTAKYRRINNFLRNNPALTTENTQLRPWVIHPQSLLTALADQWETLSETVQNKIRIALADLDATQLPPALFGILRACQVKTRRHSDLYKFFTNPKVIAYLVVLFYSTLRVLPVSLVEEFKGSLWVLWTLDIGTAFPYTWGAITMVAGRTVTMRLIGAITTAVTFAAPYVYFAMTGEEYPNYVVFVVVLFILSGFLLEGGKIVYERFLRRRLQEIRK